MTLYFIQFREGEALLYTEEEWFSEDLQPNYRRARFEVPADTPPHAVEREARWTFNTLREACRQASPTIDWRWVSPLIEEF